MVPKRKVQTAAKFLKGWKEIAAHLGQPVGTVQNWAKKSGMPIRREGRYTVVDREALSEWLGSQAHMPGAARIATSSSDMLADLRDSIKAYRRK